MNIKQNIDIYEYHKNINSYEYQEKYRHLWVPSKKLPPMNIMKNIDTYEYH